MTTTTELIELRQLANTAIEAVKNNDDDCLMDVAAFEYEVSPKTIIELLDTLEAQAKQIEALQSDADKANMFWDYDDAERSHDSIEEFLNEELCNGMGFEVGAEFTILRAKSLPKIKIRITSVDENECEADYEILPAARKGDV